MSNDKVYIVGSCSIENKDFFFEHYEMLKPYLGDKDWIYKGSFDKANRSSVEGDRGPGLEESIEIFKEFKKHNPGVKLTTDVHEVYQVEKFAGLIDVVQVPAFLCRQTDLLVECAKHFDVVNIKKGQWMSPENMAKGVDKIKSTNPNAQAWITERGTQFGYTQLIVDFGNVPYLAENYDKVILDCTHSTQRLKPNGRTGGSSELAEKYFKVADIFEYNGVFVETHPNPAEAVSDMDSQIPFDKMKILLENE